MIFKANQRISVHLANRLLMALAAGLLLTATAPAQSPPDAAQIAQAVYDRDLGEDMQMRGIMELISAKGQVRSREFISMRKDSEGQRKQLIRFLGPADIAGTAFLTLEADHSSQVEQHLYLPALQRTRRIVASQKSRSFVNSDFTYEDMQRHPVADWNYRLQGEETVMGRPAYLLLSTPKPGTETQYGKRLSWIDKQSFMPLKTIFRDPKGREIKRYTVLEIAEIDDIPTEMDVLMEDLRSGHKTRLKTLEIRYNEGLPEAFFTTRALEG